MTTVSEGREEVAKLIINGVSGNEFNSIAVGSDGTATSDGDTGLGTQVASDEGLTGSVTGEVAELSTSFTGISDTIREVSIYESTGGNMLARQVISDVPLESNDTLQIDWEIDIQDA